MTNQELQNLFQSIMLKHTNIFDVYIELKEHNDTYKTTEFYKQTKKSIFDAYELYLRGIGGIDYLITLLKNMDDSELINIGDRIAESLSLDATFNTLSDSNKELLNNLLPFLK